jgi:hypothetical protein
LQHTAPQTHGHTMRTHWHPSPRWSRRNFGDEVPSHHNQVQLHRPSLKTARSPFTKSAGRTAVSVPCRVILQWASRETLPVLKQVNSTKFDVKK